MPSTPTIDRDHRRTLARYDRAFAAREGAGAAYNAHPCPDTEHAFVQTLDDLRRARRAAMRSIAFRRGMDKLTTPKI